MPLRKLFGTDGIRGEANSSNMNSELALALGRAVAYYIRTSEELPQVVIGKDTRLSGYMLESAIASGIASMGLNVVKTGPLPTPGVAFMCRSTRARLGIVISASHNEADKNGIKLFGEDGFKLSRREEEEIEHLIFSKTPERHLARPSEVGKMTQINDAVGRYVQHLKERFPERLNLKGMKIAIDAANGAAYDVAPSVFSELGADIVTIGCSPDGHNINEGFGSLYPEKICKLTKESGADIGLALDGDADRVLLSDENGNLVDGDGILYVSAKHLHSKGNLGQATVVGTVMTNGGLDYAFRKEGIAVVRTDVGDNNIITYMRKHGINLGGEPSGHIVYLHHSSTGDGILAALRILSILRQNEKPLSEIVKGYKPFPQTTLNRNVKQKIPFEKIAEIAKAKRKIDNLLAGKGRTLLRYSGTEMVARITVESDNQKTTDKLATELADVVQRHLGT